MKTIIYTRKVPTPKTGKTLILTKKQYAQPPLNPYKLAMAKKMQDPNAKMATKIGNA